MLISSAFWKAEIVHINGNKSELLRTIFHILPIFHIYLP